MSNTAEMPFNYLIQKENKSLLYACDTGLYQDERGIS